MSRANAVQYLRYMIRHKAHHSPTHLQPRCTRVKSSSFSCHPRFRVGRSAYSGHFAVRHYVGSDGASVYWTGSFLGHHGGKRVLWVI